MKKMNSKMRVHLILKNRGIKKGQFSVIVPGKGMNPLSFCDPKGLIRVTPHGIFLYN